MKKTNANDVKIARRMSGPYRTSWTIRRTADLPFGESYSMSVMSLDEARTGMQSKLLQIGTHPIRPARLTPVERWAWMHTQDSRLIGMGQW